MVNMTIVIICLTVNMFVCLFAWGLMALLAQIGYTAQ